MATTLAQQKAVAIAPKITALASAIASAVEIVLILRPKASGGPSGGGGGHAGGGASAGPNKKALGTYHRLILGMALSDLACSSAWFFTTWPIPVGTPEVYAASGTQQTCSAQAFFAQFSLSAVMYNGSLALYYVLVIVRGWKDADVVRLEPYLHLHALAWGLGTAIASLALTLFNQVGWDCWISAAPLGCQESWNSTPDSPPTCERGDNGSLYQWAFYYTPLWLVIVIVTCLMYHVYSSVRRQENKMRKYASHAAAEAEGPVERRQSIQSLRQQTAKVSHHKRIAGQCFAYVGAFYATWLFPTLFQLVIVVTGKFPFPLLFLTALCVPVQGLLNLIVFIRPKYVRYRRAEGNGEKLFCVRAWFAVLGVELGLLDGDGRLRTLWASSSGGGSSRRWSSRRASSGNKFERSGADTERQEKESGAANVRATREDKSFRISWLKDAASKRPGSVEDGGGVEAAWDDEEGGEQPLRRQG